MVVNGPIIWFLHLKNLGFDWKLKTRNSVAVCSKSVTIKEFTTPWLTEKEKQFYFKTTIHSLRGHSCNQTMRHNVHVLILNSTLKNIHLLIDFVINTQDQVFNQTSCSLYSTTSYLGISSGQRFSTLHNLCHLVSGSSNRLSSKISLVKGKCNLNFIPGNCRKRMLMEWKVHFSQPFSLRLLRAYSIYTPIFHAQFDLKWLVQLNLVKKSICWMKAKLIDERL